MANGEETDEPFNGPVDDRGDGFDSTAAEDERALDDLRPGTPDVMEPEDWVVDVTITRDSPA